MSSGVCQSNPMTCTSSTGVSTVSVSCNEVRINLIPGVQGMFKGSAGVAGLPFSTTGGRPSVSIACFYNI